MHILYLANIRFPTDKAHGKQVREMCNAFASHMSVTLVVPNRKTHGEALQFGLNPNVRVVRVPGIEAIKWGRAGFLLMTTLFAIGSAIYVLTHRKGAAVLTREYSCALVPALARVPTVWESHRGEYNWLVRLSLAGGVRIAAITHGLKNFYVQKGVAAQNILVAPDGVDLARYNNLPTKKEARRMLALPEDKIIAVYNGHLHTWKGASTLADAALLLPSNFLVIFMGGTEKDIAAFKERYGHDARIAIIGPKPDNERPLYLRAADMCMLPNSGESEISTTFTSPLKLFGYMAAGTPIIASDLPSVREILSETTAFFAEGDNPRSFAETMQNVAKNTALADTKGEEARRVVQGYDWTHRAKTIIDFLQNRVNVRP